MADRQARVFKVTDVPLYEAEDGTARDSFSVIEDTCGARELSAGLFWVRPGNEAHEDCHTVEEAFYVFQGKATFMFDDVPFPVEEGDVIFIPPGVRHRLLNRSDDVFGLFWLIVAPWSDLTSIAESVGTYWQEVEHGSEFKA